MQHKTAGTSNNRSAARRHELYEGVSAGAAEILMQRFGMERDRAIEVAEAFIRMLMDHWRGQNIYIPSDYRYELTARDREIYDRMQRGNAQDLAAEYGLSYIRIYQICKRVAQEKRAERNLNTFSGS